MILTSSRRLKTPTASRSSNLCWSSSSWLRAYCGRRPLRCGVPPAPCPLSPRTDQLHRCNHCYLGQARIVLVKEGRELGFDVAGSRLVGSRRTVEECFTATCGVEDLVGGLAKAALSLFASGVKTGCTLQKCSFRLRNCGSDGRLGIRVFPAILEIMSGLGHSCEAVEVLTLGAFIRMAPISSSTEVRA